MHLLNGKGFGLCCVKSTRARSSCYQLLFLRSACISATVREFNATHLESLTKKRPGVRGEEASLGKPVRRRRGLTVLPGRAGASLGSAAGGGRGLGWRS